MMRRGASVGAVCIAALWLLAAARAAEAQRPVILPPVEAEAAPPPPAPTQPMADPAAASTAADAVIAPQPTPTPTVALQSGSDSLSACVMRLVPNVSADDALAVTRTLCDALRARGLGVDGPGLSPRAGAAVAYHVTLSPRGAQWNVTLRREAAGGGVTSQVTVANLDAVAPIAPRLAEAVEVPGGRAADAPAPARGLVAGSAVTGAVPDAPPAPKAARPSGVLPQFAWGPGFALYGFPGGHQWLSPGLALEVGYESSHFAFVHSLRVAVGAAGTERTELARVSFDLGVRWFAVNGPTSFFLGGGVGFLYLDVDDDPDEEFFFDTGGSEFRGDEGGGFGYVELGFELWRTHHTHLLLFGRVELPMFEVSAFISDRAEEFRYIVPISIGTTLLF